MSKRLLAFSLALAGAVPLSVASLAAQSNARLERAVERIERNDANGLRRLLKEDPSLVRRTEAGLLPHWQWTLLHKATAEQSSQDVVAALIDAGAEINVKDNEGNTPLHFAVKRINREKFPTRDYEGIIRLLLEKKADVRVVNIGGATPLHTASAFRADPSAIEMLIQAGADVNLKTFASYDAWTPLHGAAARNSAAVVAVLLKYGANPAATDGRGMTALQVAERGGFADAARVLRTSASTTAAVTSPSAASPVIVAPAATARPATTGGTVQGRVLWNGQPVPGATVNVMDNQPGSPSRGSAIGTKADDQGRFVINGVPEGNRFLMAVGDPRVYPTPGSTAFTMTAAPFTQDLHLCKGFDPVAPTNKESVDSRPVLRWDPFPDAVHYFVVILLQGKTVFSRGGPGGNLTTTSIQPDVDLQPGAYQWRLFAYNAARQMIGCNFGPREFSVR